MTLAELLPEIRKLTESEKYQLFQILKKELVPNPDKPPAMSGAEFFDSIREKVADIPSEPKTPKGLNGPQLLDTIEKRFADCPGFELPEIPRESIRPANFFTE
ncbi:MAG: hypothetical protein ACFCA4_10100 [Cyanophyceae cyanobacterium]